MGIALGVMIIIFSVIAGYRKKNKILEDIKK